MVTKSALHSVLHVVVRPLQALKAVHRVFLVLKMLEFYFLEPSMSQTAFAMRAIMVNQADHVLNVHQEDDVQEMESDGH